MAFVSSVPALRVPASRSTSSSSRARVVPRAALNLKPGIPSGQDPRSGQSLRNYVPAPVETYDERGFAEILPKTWEGEVESIGAGDVEVAELATAGEIEVDGVASSAFVQYAAMMAEERKAALAKFDVEKQTETGRATCGPEAGKESVSNARDILVSGVKCVEYWGTQW
eukprot:CAMPEP_0198314720 /NCGR_PEP_ID=MMETSP1450-20131203/5250_1 /TAXON_ID=753684 ORGANISM="Madagascaria erythrocladiodes, Strain CCMP3234" /NCGR_SAMPLE_ID=MMETSP1450 /ASSEMBLY_ACC=CAM_ASM_001115 /LENGTH=168 /DNA_ID=CAMNT_0044017793 /DNA_START=111 /DNA_END=617 /DNA_ORIENTATION=-